MTTHAPSFQQEETGLSRVEYAYRKIKNNITHNIYTSGFQILEPDLAKELGVSRTPVREALIRLEADKLIQLIPRRGMRINALSVSDVAEIFAIQYSLVELAIKKLCVADGKSIANFSAKLTCLSETDCVLTWLETEMNIFVSLVAETKNVRLRSLVQGLIEQVFRVKVIAFANIESRTIFSAHLEALLDAVGKTQVDQALLHYQRYLDAQLDEIRRIEKEADVRLF